MKEYIYKLKEIEKLLELSIGTTMTEEKTTNIYGIINDLIVVSLKTFADYAQKRMWEDGDKDLSEFVDEFLHN